MKRYKLYARLRNKQVACSLLARLWQADRSPSIRVVRTQPGFPSNLEADNVVGLLDNSIRQAVDDVREGCIDWLLGNFQASNVI